MIKLLKIFAWLINIKTKSCKMATSELEVLEKKRLKTKDMIEWMIIKY
jgi:hypothetical protein